MSFALNLIQNSQWAITEEALRSMIEVIDRRDQLEALEKLRGERPKSIEKAMVKRLLEAERGFSTKPLNKEALFGGWIKCGHPERGRVIIYDPKKKLNKTTGELVVHRYYHCANSKKVHTSLRGMSIHEDDLMDQFQSSFFSISISDQLAHRTLPKPSIRAKQARLRRSEMKVEKLSSIHSRAKGKELSRYLRSAYSNSARARNLCGIVHPKKSESRI